MAGSKLKTAALGSRQLASAISAILAMAATASAQTPPAGAPTTQARPPGPEPADGGVELDEVVVTATRRAERLQNLAESVSAITSAEIVARGLTGIEDYARLVPGLSISDRQPGGTTIVFRGVTSSGLQYGAVSSSGLYLDEQPITQSGRNPEPRFIDIERVEALRGPQGTLYGASSQSGTLRVITNKPDSSGFSGWAEGQLDSTSGGSEGYDASAMVNVPLVSDKLALRLVGFTSKDAGFIDNVLADSEGETYTNEDIVREDVNSITTSGGRAALRWDASDNVNVTLGALFQNTKAKGHGDINYGVGDLNQVRFEEETLKDDWYQAALTLNAGLPFADAVVSASYFDRDFRYDADASTYEFAFNQNAIAYDSPVYDFGGDPRGRVVNHEKTKVTTFEARLSSKADSGSRWSWLAGVFYSEEKGHTEFDSFARDYQDSPSFEYFSDYEAALTGNPLAPTERWFLGRYDTELDQKAVFGELSFDVTDHFTITAGGRWFDYERQFAQHQEQPEGFSGYSLLDDSQNTDEDGTVSKFNLRYKFSEDAMVYATYSEGFRVGGSNPLKPASALPRDYQSDELQNLEVGTKTEWFDRRLRLNFSAYYMKWKDFAVQIEDPQPAVFQLGYVNLPSAEIKGIEGEFAVKFSESFSITGAIGWNDAKTAEASTLTVTDENDVSYEFAVENGARLPLSAEWSGALSLDVRPQFTMLDARPFVRFDYSYVGSSVNSLEGIESVVSGNPVQIQHGYDIGNLRLGLEGEKWTAALFVNNLWDERAELFINNRWKVQRQSINRPRSIGFNVRFKF